MLKFDHITLVIQLKKGLIYQKRGISERLLKTGLKYVLYQIFGGSVWGL